MNVIDHIWHTDMLITMAGVVLAAVTLWALPDTPKDEQ